MQTRMSNPATILPDAAKAIQALLKATKQGGVPEAVLELVHLRASQINGCSFCVDWGARSAKKAGETDERLFAVAAAGGTLLHRRRTCRPRAHRGRHPACRPGRPGPRLDLGRGRPALRRAGTRGLDSHDRHNQPLQPPQCHHQAGGRQPELVAPDPRCSGSRGG